MRELVLLSALKVSDVIATGWLLRPSLGGARGIWRMSRNPYERLRQGKSTTYSTQFSNKTNLLLPDN